MVEKDDDAGWVPLEHQYTWVELAILAVLCKIHLDDTVVVQPYDVPLGDRIPSLFFGHAWAWDPGAVMCVACTPVEDIWDARVLDIHRL